MKKRFLLPIFILACIFIGIAFGIQRSGGVNMNKSEKIKLLTPNYTSDTSVEEALLKRRSIRNYKDETMTVEKLSQLLWSAQGVTNSKGFRTAPSAGALYPLELYVAIGDVEDISAGVYRYVPDTHELVNTLEGDKRIELYNAALRQPYVRYAQIVIIFTAVYERITRKYRGRGAQYVHMEVGHASQNVYLQAVSLGLGTVVIGAFDDEDVSDALGLKDNEAPLALMPVGAV
ncbi:SagB/ThcOx family dehydrogenase [bacterium]